MKKTYTIKLICLTVVAFACFLFGFSFLDKNKVEADTPTTGVFKMVEGAWVRLDENSGIRFRVKMSEDYYSELTTEPTSKLYIAIVPYGYYSNYIKADYEGVMAQYLDEQHIDFLSLEIPQANIYADIEEGRTYYYANAVISKMLFNNYNRMFVGVGYIVRTGDTTTYEEVAELSGYGNARSIFGVAKRADGNVSVSQQAVLDTIKEKAIYNAYGVTYNETTKKYSFDDETYDDYKDIAATPTLENMSLSATSSLKILKGENGNIVATLRFPDETAFKGDAIITYSSSDESVATVDGQGKVTAVNDGTATITVSALNGDYTATCDVEVFSYENINYAASKYYGSWNNTGITMEYDDAEQAIKLTKQGVGISGSHSHIEIEKMDEIRAAKAAGMVMMSFEYSAEDIVGTGANNPVIWVMATDGTNEHIGSGYWLTDSISITETADGEWNKVVFTLDRAIVDNTAYKYFVILVGGEQDGVVELKNIKYGDADDYDAYVKSIQILTLQASATVPMGETVDLEYSFTNLDGSAYVGDAGFVWTSSDESVATVSATGRVAAVNSGNTTITLSALDGKYTANCTVEVGYEYINFASAAKYSTYNYEEIWNDYDSSNNAIVLTKKYINLHYSHSQMEMPIMDMVRAAKAAGMKMLSFEYYAEGLNVSGTEDTTIRIVANNSTGDIAQSRCIVTDFLLTKELEGRWNKVIIDLTTTNPTYSANIANTNYKNLVFCIGGAVNGTFKIRNMVFGNATDYNTAFVTNYYDNVNYTEYQHLSDWRVLDGVDAYRDYLDYWGVLRIVKQGTNISGARDHIEIEIMDEIRAAKAAGKKLLTFEYMAYGGIYGTGANQPLLYVGVNNGTAGVVGISYWITQQITLPSTEAVYYKAYIDLSINLIDNTDFDYLSLLVGGEYDGYFCVRNMRFEGEAEYNAIKYDIVDYSDWAYWLGRTSNTWTNDCGISYDYDTVNNAVIFKGKPADLFHYGSTYLAIMDDIRGAIAAGKTKLSFEYYATDVLSSTQGNRLWVTGVDVATKDKVTGSNVWITSGISMVEDTWTKVEIDLTANNPFLANITNESNEYLGIVFDGGTDAVLEIREFKFS